MLQGAVEADHVDGAGFHVDIETLVIRLAVARLQTPVIDHHARFLVDALRMSFPG